MSQSNSELHPSPFANKLILSTKEGRIFISRHHIVFLKAEGQYTRLFLKKPYGPQRKTLHLSCINLGVYEEKLSSNFMRIARNYIINLHKIAYTHDANSLYMKHFPAHKLPIGPSYRDAFYAQLPS